jgi:hypothetical protein
MIIKNNIMTRKGTLVQSWFMSGSIYIPPLAPDPIPPEFPDYQGTFYADYGANSDKSYACMECGDWMGEDTWSFTFPYSLGWGMPAGATLYTCESGYFDLSYYWFDDGNEHYGYGWGSWNSTIVIYVDVYDTVNWVLVDNYTIEIPPEYFMNRQVETC